MRVWRRIIQRAAPLCSWCSNLLMVAFSVTVVQPTVLIAPRSTYPYPFSSCRSDCIKVDIASSTGVFLLTTDHHPDPAREATGGLPPAIKNEPPQSLIKERR